MPANISATRQNTQPLNYGIDAPELVWFFLIAGTGAAGLALAAHVYLDNSTVRVILGLLTGIAALYLLGMGCLMLYWSKVVKVREREGILDLIPWRGDEKILDVGCGRGLMLIGAARRLTTGTAVGIDVWQAADQSDNGPNATYANAEIAGVDAKIDVLTADARELPFASQSFDVVMSHWVVHNVSAVLDRDLVLTEMVRVLRPGGYLLVADISFRDAYLTKLKALGVSDCRMVYRPIRDAVLGALSFGSFRPSTIIGRVPSALNEV
jgi:arsenite methyltransferase